MTTHQPTVHPHDGRTTVHRALAGISLVAALAYVAGAAWLAAVTWAGIRTASPDSDQSLAGLSYVLAVVLVVLAVPCGVGGAVGWRVARRSPAAGTALLVVAVAIASLPAWFFVSAMLG
jgi:hypothetical protein